MTKGQQWPSETKARAVEMYRQGYKYREITAETGVPQATIHGWLSELGIRKGRLQPTTGDVSVAQVLEQLRMCEAEKARLQLENELLRSQLATPDNGV